MSSWVLLSILSAICTSLANFFIKKRSEESSPLQSVLFGNILSIIILAPFVISDIRDFSFVRMSPVLILIGVLSFLTIVTFIQAIKIDMAKTSMSIPIGFITTTASGIFVLHEFSIFKEDPIIFVSFVFAIIGFYILIRGSGSNTNVLKSKWIYYRGLNMLFFNAMVLVTKSVASETQPVLILFMSQIVGVFLAGVILKRRKERLLISKPLLSFDMGNALGSTIGGIAYLTTISFTELSKVVLIRTPLISIFTIIWGIVFLHEKSLLTKKNVFGGAFIFSALLLAM